MSRALKGLEITIARTAVTLALGVVCLAGCAKGCPDQVQGASLSFTTSSGPVRPGAALSVAQTPEARARGLMGVTSLPSDGGMVFLSDGPSLTPFWMKNTKIPLSVAFWDDSGKIVDILDMKPCTADPCPYYTPSNEYVGAVEMNLGWFTEHGVRTGDHAEFDCRST